MTELPLQKPTHFNLTLFQNEILMLTNVNDVPVTGKTRFGNVQIIFTRYLGNRTITIW